MTLCEGDLIAAEDLQLPYRQAAVTPPAAVAEPPALDPYLASLQKEAIRKALETTRYNKTAAAKLLGISFRQLRYRLKKLGMD